MTTKKQTQDDNKIRLNKFLSQQGILSRRKVDEYIDAKRIKVAGKLVTEQGFKVDVDEKNIEIDDIPLDISAPKYRYFLFYKPKKVVSTLSDPERRPCLSHFLTDIEERLVPAGRLDYDAEGLMLLSNDGQFVQQMMHPKFSKKKVYEVKLKGLATGDHLQRLKKGIKLDDGWATAHSAKFLKKTDKNSWIEMTLTDGRKHQIKRMWLQMGVHVLKIIRIRFSIFSVANLKPGQLREIPFAEAQKLMKKI